MKRILATIALALAASPLMAECNNPGYICSGPHKYSCAADGSFPCLPYSPAGSEHTLAGYKGHALCLAELMANWSAHNLTFTKANPNNARTQAKIVAKFQAAVADCNAGNYESAFRNIATAGNKVSKLMKDRKVVCAEGEDILLPSFDATDVIELILFFPPEHPES